ncbi:three-Cys-motif partner protein TcmP [Arthrobacter sp. StoSoilB13]|uniref:three-Cys-motif partner protein TcmP n=1 Tax=Arthrobacter sp. StoSoilB13 TaxID=2830993 RepID=UPI001CC7F7DA|nr:three-Cys-motif partner protein TcmP [Arthrobacter sp. StoSoilB13]BCW50009.1 hypothetical protein StoSoilB13_23510 [Arthrobacter sp. StoSoilB13]
MSSTGNFFESPQAAAVYKHRLLKSYIPAWAGKVGSTAEGKKVVVYDAYAGPGRYGSNHPGSPELLVDTAQSMADLRNVFTVFSEKSRNLCGELEELLSGKGVPPSSYQVRLGPVDAHLDEVLKLSRDLPLFIFLDPFGLTVSFDRIVHALSARDIDRLPYADQPKTELLMNFSYEAVRRIAGALRSGKSYAAKEAQVAALDNALGGDWWQDVALSGDDEWVQKILIGFADRVGQAAGYGYITADVADSLDAKPVYELILFTRHDDGLWEMAQAMSYARRDWRQWLVDQAERRRPLQPQLPGLDFRDNEAAWIDEIAVNIESILIDAGPFRLNDKLDRVFGRTLGLAREMHVRKALRLLQTSGVISSVPKGGLQRAYIS